MYNNRIHPDFKISGKNLSAEAVVELGYSYIKEGAVFETQIGQFLLDWMDSSTEIKVQTSGSTGRPKSIVLKKEYMVNSALATGRYFKLAADDLALLCLPAAYIAGKMMLVRAMVLGLNLYIVPPSSDPLSGTSAIFDFAAMVPLQAMNSLLHLHRIKTVLIGGAPVSQELGIRLKNVTNFTYETYGMTETITHIAAKRINGLSDTINNLDTPFKVLPGISLTVDHRNCLVIDAPKVSDEIISTNDVVELISPTSFKWLGRFDNVINSGGIKLHPERIERILSRYITAPFFITGLKDQNLGQQIVLVVEGRETPDTIRAVLDSIQELETYERPKRIIIAAHFQRTESGKIQRSKTLKKVLEQ